MPALQPPRMGLPALHRAARWVLCVALASGASQAGAMSGSTDLSLALASSTVLRGVALGDGGVDAQAQARYAHADGWRVAIGAAALHSSAPSRRWDAQWLWRVGHARRLNDDWSAQLMLGRYGYRGTAYLRLYAQDELGATVAWRDETYLSVTALRRRTGPRDGTAVDLVMRRALPWPLTATAGVGHVRDRAPGTAHAYGHVGLAAAAGASQVELLYVATDAAAKRRFRSAAANRWVASVHWDF